MSDIALIMNALLGALLVGALFVGWRLESRLKALKASHQSFAQAVADLDRAAGRAEQGLADLRAATDEAADSLAGRIERAKTLLVHSQLSLKQIATLCGFRDEYYFSAVFRRFADLPPGRYRARQR